MATQYPPVAIWSADDRSGPIIIVTTLCMFYWLIPGILQQTLSLAHDIRFTWAEGVFMLSMVRTFRLMQPIRHLTSGRLRVSFNRPSCWLPVTMALESPSITRAQTKR